MSQSFVHLHCHSHYSLLDSTATIGQLVARTKELGMNALALTDTGNLHGALEFYSACKDAGIKPIIGYEALVAPETAIPGDGRSWNTLTLLARDKTGFDTLLKLATKASLEGKNGLPMIDWQYLEACNEGLLCLSSGMHGELTRAIMGSTTGWFGAMAEACRVARRFQVTFGDRYFIEIQDTKIPNQRLVNEAALDVARELGIPPVATCDCHYVSPEDAEAHDILTCLKSGRTVSDADRPRLGSNEFYLKSPQQMYAAFERLDRDVIAEAVSRTQAVADSVSLDHDLTHDLVLTQRHFPSVEVPSGRTPIGELRRLCLEGLHERYASIPQRWAEGKTPSSGGSGELHPDVLHRLEQELAVIDFEGFVAGLFLVVGDVVRDARNRGIPVAARGACVSSLVLYGLWCSHACVFEHDLLFERFLTLHPDGQPVFDIDVCKERRGEVIDYLRQKYGERNVAGVASFGTRRETGTIRDLERALGYELILVPRQCGITREEATAPGTDLCKACDADAEFDLIAFIALAKRIDGLVSNVGTHGAAVVIADRPLVEYVPLCRGTNNEEVIAQWAIGDVERVGLMRLGLFGNRHLTVISRALDTIQAATGVRPDPLRFPVDDEATFAMLCRGDTDGIFQLASGGLQELLRRLRPDRFSDIIAINALYRPGPLEAGMVDEYLEVKHFRKEPKYIHPDMETILAETYGVILYEEQIMQLLERLGGCGLGTYSLLMAALRMGGQSSESWLWGTFLKRASTKGIGEEQGSEILAFIERFARHAFNKSHAIAYALLAWQTAYLKTHYRDAYMQAAEM